jgi:hypothetical protein
VTVTRRELILGLLVVALALLVWYLVPSEEDRIRKRLEEAARALEQEDARGVMSVIDVEHFTDPIGAYDPVAMEDGLGEAFRMFDNIEVVMEKPRIRIEEDKRHALITLRFVITGIYEGQFGFIVGTTQETALARFIMEKSPEAGWRVVELTAAKLPGI